MTRGRSPGVVVIGGGVIGCAVARRAALAGRSVVVVERGTPGAEASWAAAGMLSPLAEASAPGPFLDLLLAARERWPAFAAALREETGADVAYHDAGTLYLSLRADDDAELEHRLAWQSAAGLGVERLAADEARRLEPAINPAVRFGLRFPDDHQVDNRLLGPALWRAAERAGVRFRLGETATSVEISADRATAVRLASGERIATEAVVVAGGCWAGQLGGLPRALPVEPVHGQLVALGATAGRHVIDSPRCYLVPRADGRTIAGATLERTGYRKAVTDDATAALHAAAAEIAPSLAQAPRVETWSGLRPGTPDGRPILGADPEVPNLLYATGHYRNGILLTPLTGDLVGALLLGEAPDVDLAPYSIARFG